MAKPVKKENEETVQKDLSIFLPEELLLSDQEMPHAWITQLKQLDKAKGALEELQLKTENQMIDFLHENFIFKYKKGFLSMLSTNYCWGNEIYDKNHKFLNEGCLKKNYKSYSQSNKKIEYCKVTLSSKIEMNILRREYKDFDGYWDDVFRDNPFLNIEFVTFYKNQYAEWPEYLSDNKVINWNKDLLKTFATEWHYDKLIENWSLHWSEDLLEFIAEIYEEAFEDAVFSDDYEIENLVNDMNSGIKLWDRISNDRYRTWDVEFIKKNKNLINWSLLSANPSLPFTFELFEHFEDNWDMGNSSSDFGVWENASFFEKVFAPLLNDSIVEKIIKRYY